MTDLDVVIVGAGPAGCSAAYDLCKAGRSVLLLDHHDFPRRKACAGGLTVKTLRALRYSVEPVIERSCDSIQISFRHRRGKLLSAPSTVCAMVVREEFDSYCFKQTRDAGAKFKRIRHLDSISEMPDKVVVETDSETIEARFLVGADGADSRVRKLTSSFHPANSAIAVEGIMRIPDVQQIPMTFDFGVMDRGYGWVFPKKDHVNVGLGCLRISPGCCTRRMLEEYAEIKFPGVELSETIGHRIGIGGWSYHPKAERVCLVGDAGGFAESLLAEGIYNAIVTGQAAAASIDRSLESGESLASTYQSNLEPVQKDLRLYRRGASLFYRFKGLGYSILTTSIFHKRLMNGFASGQRFSDIKIFGVV